MNELTCISDYLNQYGADLGQRVVEQFPPLHQPSEPAWPALEQLKRRPFPAQTLAIMGIVKRWEEARCAAAVAECGTGKTLISLGSVFTHARRRRFTALAMVPPQLVEKWARECFLTLPGVRVFFVDGVRNGASSNGFTGVNGVKFRAGRIVREGLRTTLSDMRLAKQHRSAHARWDTTIGAPSIFIISRERAKLGYFWRHAYGTPRSGPFLGSVVNPDTGKPILTSDDQLRRPDFRKVKHSELITPDSAKGRLPIHSALWQADNGKIARMAPVEFVGRFLSGFFEYGIADEVHELKGETAQGNALGTYLEAHRHKVDRIAGYWRWQQSIADICGKEAERLAARKRATENRVMRLKGFLLGFMSSRGIRRLEGEKSDIAMQRNSTASLVIDDPLQLPERFLECSIRFTKIELQEVAHQMAEGELRRRLEATLKSKDWETNGEAIRAAIVNSQLSASARLVVGSHLRIR